MRKSLAYFVLLNNQQRSYGINISGGYVQRKSLDSLRCAAYVYTPGLLNNSTFRPDALNNNNNNNNDRLTAFDPGEPG